MKRAVAKTDGYSLLVLGKEAADVANFAMMIAEMVVSNEWSAHMVTTTFDFNDALQAIEKLRCDLQALRRQTDSCERVRTEALYAISGERDDAVTLLRAVFYARVDGLGQKVEELLARADEALWRRVYEFLDGKP